MTDQERALVQQAVTMLKTGVPECDAGDVLEVLEAALAQEQAEPVATFDEVWDAIDWDKWRKEPIRELVRMIHGKTSPRAEPAQGPEGGGALPPPLREPEEFDYGIGSGRFKVVRGAYWWHVLIGDSPTRRGRFHTQAGAEEMAALLLREFRNGAFTQHKTAPAKPVQELHKWREAVINELVTAHIYTGEHDANPRKAVQDAITWNCQVALDPLVSSDAMALVRRGLEEAVQMCEEEGSRIDAGWKSCVDAIRKRIETMCAEGPGGATRAKSGGAAPSAGLSADLAAGPDRTVLSLVRVVCATPSRLTDSEIGEIWFAAKIPGLTETSARILIRAAEERILSGARTAPRGGFGDRAWLADDEEFEGNPSFG